MNNKKLDKKEVIQGIRQIFYKISRIAEGRQYFDSYFENIKRGEKQHRKLRPDCITTPYGMTVTDSTICHSVMRIFESKENKPKLENYLYIKKEVFEAYGIYSVYKEQLKAEKIFSKKNRDLVKAFVYSEFI